MIIITARVIGTIRPVIDKTRKVFGFFAHQP